jgi:hypothetical protein
VKPISDVQRLANLHQGLTNRLAVADNGFKEVIEARMTLVAAWKRDLENGWLKFDERIEAAVKEFERLAVRNEEPQRVNAADATPKRGRDR